MDRTQKNCTFHSGESKEFSDLETEENLRVWYTVAYLYDGSKILLSSFPTSQNDFLQFPWGESCLNWTKKSYTQTDRPLILPWHGTPQDIKTLKDHSFNAS